MNYVAFGFRAHHHCIVFGFSAGLRPQTANMLGPDTVFSTSFCPVPFDMQGEKHAEGMARSRNAKQPWPVTHAPKIYVLPSCLGSAASHTQKSGFRDVVASG